MLECPSGLSARVPQVPVCFECPGSLNVLSARVPRVPRCFEWLECLQNILSDRIPKRLRSGYRVSVVILMKHAPFFFKIFIFDGCFWKYKVNVPICDNIGRCLYFLEHALPTSPLGYCFPVFKYISIIHLWIFLSNSFGTKIIRLTQHFWSVYLFGRTKFFDVACRISFVKFSYWSKFQVNIITSSEVMTIFLCKGLTRNLEIRNTHLWVLPNIWSLAS